MDRPIYLRRIHDAFEVNPVVGILGPRQVGKSTLAGQFAEQEIQAGRPVTFFDLEKDADLAALQDPYTTLRRIEGTVIIDEIQRRTGLFETLRVLVDETKRNVRYLVLGSASRDLLRQSSETLAGRIHYMELTSFSLAEVTPAAEIPLWVRGGLPPSFLAATDAVSLAWRQDYIRTFLERDIPALGIRIPAAALRRFWMMLTHIHGQILNVSDIGRSLGISDHTVRHYLEILSGTFMIRLLQPWHENIGKRQVKAPKIYFRDSGIFHALAGIASHQDLLHHPKLGASWEAFAVEEVLREANAQEEETFFWAVHAQSELDLMLFKGGRRLGFEIKYADAPSVTRSMRSALELLHLDRLMVVYPGTKSFPMDDKIDAVPLSQVGLRAVQGSL